MPFPEIEAETCRKDTFSLRYKSYLCLSAGYLTPPARRRLLPPPPPNSSSSSSSSGIFSRTRRNRCEVVTRSSERRPASQRISPVNKEYFYIILIATSRKNRVSLTWRCVRCSVTTTAGSRLLFVTYRVMISSSSLTYHDTSAMCAVQEFS